MSSKRSNNKSAASKVANNEDVLIEIFLRLPPKSLMKFKCVSKYWLSLISDPYFCSSHVRFQSLIDKPKSDDTVLLLNTRFDYSSTFEVIPLQPSTRRDIVVEEFLKVPQAKILQCCNGLLICRSSFLVDPQEDMELYGLHEDVTIDRCSSVVSDENRGYVYFLCNPTTGQFKRLSYDSCPLLENYMRIPYPEYHYKIGCDLVSVCLAFDPKISLHYKVIFIIDLSHPYDPFTGLIEIFIYSSETDSWTVERRDASELHMHSMDDPFDFGRELGIDLKTDVFFCNGAIYWWRNHGDGITSSLLCFDVAKMIFKTKEFGHRTNFMSFGEFEGNLHVVSHDFDRPDTQYDVLEIAADFSICFKYHISLQSIRPEYPDWKCYYFNIFRIISGKNVEETKFVMYVDGKVMLFHPSNGNFEPILDAEARKAFTLINSYAFFFKTCEFVDSLVSP